MKKKQIWKAILGKFGILLPTKSAQFLFYSIFIIFLFLKYSLGFSNSPDRLRTRYNVMLEEAAPTCRSPLIILLLSAACLVYECLHAFLHTW